MDEIEGIGWARQVLGEVGPHVRQSLPETLLEVHNSVSAVHFDLGLGSADAYGLMWLAVPRALVEQFSGAAGVEAHRLKRCRYHLPVVNGVPLVPWRYAKDSTTDFRLVPFGQPVSETRRNWFNHIPQQQLPLGESGLGDAVLAALTEEDRADLDALTADLQEMAHDQRQVAVLAYASNPDALLRCHLGYARLSWDDTLDWAFVEELSLPTDDLRRLRQVPQASDLSSFDAGMPDELVLRPRSPLEGEPSPGGDPEGTEIEAEDDDG